MKWEAVENKIRRSGDVEFDDGVIAYVASRIDEDEETRHARLIAAAPEMLDALRKIFQIYRCDWSAMTPEEKKWASEYANSDEKCELLLRSAIRKAEEGQ